MTELIHPDLERAERAVVEFLRAFGLDPDTDETLRATPRRVSSSFVELFAGLGADASAALSDAIPVGEQEPEFVTVRDLRFHSVCEHHLLPFNGICTIVYVPGERVVGVARFSDALATLAARPQVQERLGEQFAQTVADALHARGVLIYIEAIHGCLSNRGPKQTSAKLATISTRGILSKSPAQAGALILAQGQPQ
jgi:GTP cyclohydrolase I